MNLFFKEMKKIFSDLFNLITNNFWLKFLSLIFAFVLFFIVRTDKETVLEKVLKVKIVTLPSMTVVGPKERNINATIKVRNTFWSVPPTENELVGEVDISSTNPGKINVKIGKENFSKIPKNYYVFIDKPYIEIEIDKVLEKKLKIKPTFIGKPAEGFFVSGIRVFPEQIRVSGGSKEMTKMEHVGTVPINIDGIKETFITDVMIDDLDKSSLFSEKKYANVIINVEKKK